MSRSEVYVLTSGRWSDEEIMAVFSSPAAVQEIIPAFPADDPPGRWMGEAMVRDGERESEATVTVYQQRMDPDELTFVTDYYSMPVDPANIHGLD